MNLSRRLEAPLSDTEMQHNDYKDTDYTIYKVLLRLESLRDHVTIISHCGLRSTNCHVNASRPESIKRNNHRNNNTDGNLKTRTRVKLFQPAESHETKNKQTKCHHKNCLKKLIDHAVFYFSSMFVR